MAFVFGPYRLDAATRELYKNDIRVAMPPRVFACLLYLLQRRERAVDRDELIAALWDGRSATDVQLAQLIVQCRRAVDDDGQAQRAIRTVAGFGYRWVEPVEEGPSTTTASMPIVMVDAAPDVSLPLSNTKRRTMAFVWVAVVFLAALIAWRYESSRKAAAPGRVLVLPIDVSDTDAGWLRLGGMDVLIDRLRRNDVPVLSSEATVSLLQHLDPDDKSRDVHALAPRARHIGEAVAVVVVAASKNGGEWRMTATLERDGASSRNETASGADLLAVLRELADRASGKLGHPPAEPDTHAAKGSVALTLQQARAALLANDPRRARELLEANPELVADEPLLRQQLAEVDIRAGRYIEARDALDALLARNDGDAAFRAKLLNARGTVSVRTGRFVDAGNEYSSALALLDPHGDPIALGRAYLGRGVSRTSLQDYADAQMDYASAREAFERAGDLGSVARVESDIGALEILRGHMAQAEAYLDRAERRFDDFGMIQEWINTLQLAYVARRGQLKNTEAASTIDTAWSTRARIVSPSSLLSTGLYRVESLLNAGRRGEASALLDTLATSARAAAGAENDRWQLMRARLLREEGRFEDALALLDGVAEAPHESADDDTVRASVALMRARLERILHRSDAASIGAGAAAVASPTPRTPLRLLAEANRAWARDDLKSAEAAFGAALQMADEQGIAQTLAAVAADRVDFLIASGRAAEARAVAARVALWVDADYDCALLELKIAHAQGNKAAWPAAIARARRLAGERTLPPELIEPPR